MSSSSLPDQGQVFDCKVREAKERLFPNSRGMHTPSPYSVHLSLPEQPGKEVQAHRNNPALLFLICTSHLKWNPVTPEGLVAAHGLPQRCHERAASFCHNWVNLGGFFPLSNTSPWFSQWKSGACCGMGSWVIILWESAQSKFRGCLLASSFQQGCSLLPGWAGSSLQHPQEEPDCCPSSHNPVPTSWQCFSLWQVQSPIPASCPTPRPQLLLVVAASPAPRFIHVLSLLSLL